MSMKDALRLPVVAGGAEYLVMGYLMRRNILTYRAPPGNEGYDLICIHPESRHVPKRGQKSQVRVQVKSRFATDAGRGFPLNTKSLDAFDYVVAVFMNIGRFGGKRTGSDGAKPVEFYICPPRLCASATSRPARGRRCACGSWARSCNATATMPASN